MVEIERGRTQGRSIGNSQGRQYTSASVELRKSHDYLRLVFDDGVAKITMVKTERRETKRAVQTHVHYPPATDDD